MYRNIRTNSLNEMFDNTFLNKLYNNYLKQKITKYFLCQLLDVGTIMHQLRTLCTLYAGNNISKTVRTFIISV